MKIIFELKEIHRVILTSIYLGCVERQDDLQIAISLVQATGDDYAKLLMKVIKDGVYRTRPFSFLPRLAGLREGSLKASNSLKALNQLELLDLLKTEEVLSGAKDNQHVEYIKLTLTDEGLRVAKAVVEGRRPILRPPSTARTTIFVACAFGREQLDALFESEIRPACEQVGFLPFRVDMSEPEHTLTARIVEGILGSRCLIADLTFARPSVYFEVGIAHGLGVPILLTCREDHYRNHDDSQRVHFDLEQYKISFWRPEAKGSGFFWPNRMSPTERLEGILAAAPNTGLNRTGAALRPSPAG